LIVERASSPSSNHPRISCDEEDPERSPRFFADGKDEGSTAINLTKEQLEFVEMSYLDRMN
jgi:hypothetical protein